MVLISQCENYLAGSIFVRNHQKTFQPCSRDCKCSVGLAWPPIWTPAAPAIKAPRCLLFYLAQASGPGPTLARQPHSLQLCRRRNLCLYVGWIATSSHTAMLNQVQGWTCKGAPEVGSLMRGTPWGELGLFAFLPWSPCPPGQDTGGYHGVCQGSGGGCGCRHRKIWPVTGFLVWETHLPCPYIFRLFCNKVIHKVHTGVSCSIMCPWKLFLSIQMSSFLFSQWGIYVIFMRIIFYDELI